MNDEPLPAPEQPGGDMPPLEATPLPPEVFPFWGFTDVLLFLGLSVPVFFVAYGAAYWPLSVVGVESRGLRLLLPQFVGYTAALVPLWLIFKSRYGRSPLEALRLGMSLPVAIQAVPLGIGAALSVLLFGVLLRTPPIETPMQDLLRDPVSIAVVGLLASTIGPVFEELFFRGLLQPLLVLRMGLLTGVLLAALPFALLHGPQYAWSWRHIVLITAAGAMFGWQRARTDSTGAAAVMHAAYNLTLFVGFLAGKAMEDDLIRSV